MSTQGRRRLFQIALYEGRDDDLIMLLERQSCMTDAVRIMAGEFIKEHGMIDALTRVDISSRAPKARRASSKQAAKQPPAQPVRQQVQEQGKQGVRSMPQTPAQRERRPVEQVSNPANEPFDPSSFFSGISSANGSSGMDEFLNDG